MQLTHSIETLMFMKPLSYLKVLIKESTCKHLTVIFYSSEIIVTRKIKGLHLIFKSSVIKLEKERKSSKAIDCMEARIVLAVLSFLKISSGEGSGSVLGLLTWQD